MKELHLIISWKIAGAQFRVPFFINNFELEEDEVYEFVLGALENSNIEKDFRTSDHSLVLESFEKFHKSIIDEKN